MNRDEDSDSSSEFGRVNRVVLPKSSEEYRQRRERNNAAVKKSRYKSKQKTLETQKRVDQLKNENSDLERRVESLNRELNFMRAIFVPRRDPQSPLQAPNQHLAMPTIQQQSTQPQLAYNQDSQNAQVIETIAHQTQDENNIQFGAARYLNQ